MKLIEDIYHQRVSFLRRNMGEPDILLVPYNQKHQLLGELLEKYAPIHTAEDLRFMGMKLVYVYPEAIKHVTVVMSAAQVK